jgi:hypothetical protein
MIEACNVMVSDDFAIIYDLQDAHAWRQAHAHRRLWGRRFCEHYILDDKHVVVLFNPGGARWASWEAYRRQRILGRGLGDEAA